MWYQARTRATATTTAPTALSTLPMVGLSMEFSFVRDEGWAG
jgi:hypothetical protein